MVFREVSVVEIREVLRAWLDGAGLRTVGERAGVDRKTARRYVQAAEAAGLIRDAGADAITDELVGAVVAAVRPVAAERARAGVGGVGRVRGTDPGLGHRDWDGEGRPATDPGESP